MVDPKRKLVIVGDGETAQLAYEYFTADSPFEVVGFSVEKQFLKRDKLNGLPVVPFETLEEAFDPDATDAFVAVSYTQLNRVRARLFAETRAKGYTTPSYLSSRAFVWRTAKVGANCFVFEGNVVQHGVELGDDVILWSGNHIGHQAKIRDHVYVASHVVISGFCEIGENSFLGVNACISDRVKVAKDCIIGAGAVVLKDTEPGKVYVGNPAKALEKTSFESFGVKEAA